MGIGNPELKGKIKTQDFSFNKYALSPKNRGGYIADLAPLPGTLLELKAISKLPIFDKSTLYISEMATEGM